MYEAIDFERSSASDRTWAEIGKQARGGPNVEPPIAALFSRILQDDSEPIRAMVEESAEFRNNAGYTIGSIVTALRISIIDYCTEREKLHGRRFEDLHRTRAREWNEPLGWVKDALEDTRTDLSDPFVQIAMRLKNTGLYMAPNTSPLYRGNGSETLAQLAAERWPDGARGLDIGSSTAVTALSHLYKDNLPAECLPVFGFNEVTTKPDGKDLTQKANRILGRPSIFKDFLCVDTYPAYYEDRQAFDEHYRERAINALRPSERGDQNYVATIEALHAKKDPNSPHYDPKRRLRFVQANLLDTDELYEFKDRFTQPFDVININFVTQEMTSHDFVALFRTALGLLSENGLLSVVHQARLKRPSQPRPVSIAKFRPYERYATSAWRSNLHLADALNPDGFGIQQMMNFYDNRCRRARVDAGRLVVNGVLEPLQDLIRYAA
jgi:hypothetical protein